MCARMSTHVSVCLTPTVRQGHPSPGWLPRSALIQEMVKGTEAPPVKAPPLASSLPNASLSYFQVLSPVYAPGEREPPVLLPELGPNQPGRPKAGPRVRLGSRQSKRAGGPCRALPSKGSPGNTEPESQFPSFPCSLLSPESLDVGAAGHMATNVHP